MFNKVMAGIRSALSQVCLIEDTLRLNKMRDQIEALQRALAIKEAEAMAMAGLVTQREAHIRELNRKEPTDAG